MDELAARLAQIPGVVAVAMGGSRVLGEARPDSDWDFGIYYQDSFDWQRIQALGHLGTVSAPGAWGRLMNGGAWLMVEGQRVDLLYRDIRVVEYWTEEAEQGRFEVDAVPGYLSGMPTYALMAELALNRFLYGAGPAPSYPEALRVTAPPAWRSRAALSLSVAEQMAERDQPLECGGMLAAAAHAAAQAILAERAEWTLNERRQLQRAGLAEAAVVLRAVGTNVEELRWSVSRMRQYLGIRRSQTLAFDQPG